MWKQSYSTEGKPASLAKTRRFTHRGVIRYAFECQVSKIFFASTDVPGPSSVKKKSTQQVLCEMM